MQDAHRDPYVERAYKMNSRKHMDHINLEGSQTPVYKVTRLKSELLDYPAKSSKMGDTYHQRPLGHLRNGARRKSDQISYGSDFDSLEQNTNISSSECDEPVGQANLSHDVIDVTMNKRVSGTIMKMENMLPEPPLRMTYILPKEPPDFRNGKGELTIIWKTFIVII